MLSNGRGTDLQHTGGHGLDKGGQGLEVPLQHELGLQLGDARAHNLIACLPQGSHRSGVNCRD